MLAKGCVLLASKLPEDKPDDRLDQDIDAFFHSYVDLPGDFYPKLLRNYVKLTWVFDRFNSLPYLRILGGWGSGKTRVLETAGALAFRGIASGGSVSGAVLFRLIDRYKGTLLLDEADFKNTDLFADLTKILNVGYRRGMYIYRCNADNEPEPFDPFGPKIMTGRKRFGDEALESRCITIEVQKRRIRDDIPRQLPDAFFAESQQLQNRLLAYRFATYDKIAVDEKGLLDLDPRSAEIAAPLIAVSNSDSQFTAQLKEHLGGEDKTRRHESVEAIFVRAIDDVIKGRDKSDKKEKREPRSTFILQLKEVAQAASIVRELQEPQRAAAAKGSMAPMLYFNTKKAGQVVRNLGFEPVHTRAGAQFEVTRDHLKDLLDRYKTPDDKRTPGDIQQAQKEARDQLASGI
jgi:hypothetical protein